MTFRPLATLLTAAALLLLGGCHIENHGEHDWTDYDEADSGTVCASFCNRLFSCGNIGPGQYASCVDGCESKFAKDEWQTRAGCKCVAKATCQDAKSYGCAGAPIPGVSGPATETPGPNTPDTATPDTATPGPDASSPPPDTSTPAPDTTGGVPPKAYTCKVNADCIASEDCVSGYCLVRCNASCECHLGETCQAGYCSLPVAPAKTCVADCDCPSGGKCVSGKCQ